MHNKASKSALSRICNTFCAFFCLNAAYSPTPYFYYSPYTLFFVCSLIEETVQKSVTSADSALFLTVLLMEKSACCCRVTSAANAVLLFFSAVNVLLLKVHIGEIERERVFNSHYAEIE